MKISVITVSRNVENEIEKTINSVLTQKSSSFELEYIVIDGQSTDGTVQLIKRYEKEITYWVSEPDRGIYDAMNKGIEKATGEYVIFMNAGDWFENKTLERVADTLNDEPVDIIYGKVPLVIDNKKWGYIGIKNESELPSMYVKNAFCHQGMVIKRELFNEIGLFDINYKVLADYDWNLKAYSANKTIKIMDFDIANFSYGGTCSTVRKAEEYKEIVSKYNQDNKNTKIIEKTYKDYQLWDDYKDGLKRLSGLYGDDYEIPKMPNMKDKYSIWGAGGNGEECYHCFSKMGVQIICFIDRDPNKKEFHDMEIKRPDKDVLLGLLKIGGICISSTDYEEEIKQELAILGINTKDIITFRDIEKWIRGIR